MRYHLYLGSFLKVFRIIEKCLTENLVVPKLIWFSVPWSWCFSQQPLQVRRKQYCKTTFWFTLIRLMPFTDLWPFLSFSVYEGMNRMYFPSSKSITYFSLNCWKCLKSQLLSTVPCRLNRLFGLLWYDFRVFWLSITCLKSAAKCLFSFYHNKYRSDLSKKFVFGPVGQKASKM